MKKTVLYLSVMLLSFLFYTNVQAQETAVQAGQAGAVSQGAQQTTATTQSSDAQSAALQALLEEQSEIQQQIALIKEQIANLQAQLQNTQDLQQRAKLQNDIEAMQGKLAKAEKDLQKVQQDIQRVQYELQAQQAEQHQTSLAGVSGSPIVNRNSDSQYNDSYQLIPVNNTADAQKVTTYLDDLIKGGFNGKFEQNPSTTNWVFVSSADENIAYNKPYLKNGTVWFDVAPKKDKSQISLWLFQMPAGQDFRVRFNGEKSAEMSSATLLGERFKKGINKAQTAGAFEINSSGEYYEDNIILSSGQGDMSQKAFGNISYTSNISAKIGTMFGFEYTSLNRMTRNYNFKCIHPPYTSGPEQGATEFMMAKQCVPGKKDNFIWKITEAYELVPGTWKLQILDGGVLIYQKNFNLSIAAAGHAAVQGRSGVSAMPAGAGISAQTSQTIQREKPGTGSGALVQAGQAKPLIITLTPEQSAAVSGSRESEVIISLTDKQFETIRRRYPRLSKRTMKLSISAGAVAAPFVPGGAVLSAAVSGIGQMKEALGTVSRESQSD